MDEGVTTGHHLVRMGEPVEAVVCAGRCPSRGRSRSRAPACPPVAFIPAGSPLRSQSNTEGINELKRSRVGDEVLSHQF